MRISIVAVLILIGGTAFPQPFYQNGQLPLYNIPPSEYVKQQPQNFNTVVDTSGLIFVCNNGGIMVYDGVRWERVLNFEGKALVLNKDKDAVIYIGGENKFGFISHDSLGNFTFKPLSDVLPDSVKKFGRLSEIQIIDNSVFFIADGWIFKYVDYQLDWLSKKIVYRGSFILNSILYVNEQDEGLLKLDNNNLQAISNEKIVLPYTEFTAFKGSVLAINRTGLKLFSIKDDGISILNQKEFGQEWINSEIEDIELSKGYIFVATRKNGLIIMNEQFEFLKSVNSSNSPLQSNYIEDITQDSDQNLWLSLNKGISVIDINSSYDFFGNSEDMNGTINDIVVRNSKVFIGADQGLQELELETAKKFINTENIKGECWSIENIRIKNKSYLFVATDKSIELLDNGELKHIIDAYPWDIHQSKFNDSRIWIGEESGFFTIYWDGKEFKKEFQNLRLATQLRKVVSEINGNLWMGTRNGGVYYLDEGSIDSNQVKNPIFYDTTSGLPVTNYVYPFEANGLVFFATTKGIYEFQDDVKVFSKSTRFKNDKNLADRNILNIFPAGENSIWITSRDKVSDAFENGIYNFDGNIWSYKPFMTISKSVQFAGYYDENYNNLWIGGSLGLFRIKNTNPKENSAYRAYITEVSYPPDSILFGGHMFEGFSNNTYNYSRRPLRFSFGANSYKRKDDLKFKYFLEGFDENWTDWNNEAEAVYTNLPGGSYTMRVKAIDFFQNESKEASFSFTILPPWYLTPWAYTFYFLGFIGFVYGAIRVSTISLQRVIKENTKEIVAQKDEIEAKNSVLENQKGRIEKQNLNILDSIRYAKRIQMATLPAEDKIQKSVENAWVMYRPKDIVSGDFYWLENFKDEKVEKTLIAAVDCTGHGVPGAFMSIIGYNGLNRVVREYRLNQPSEVLDRLNEIITTTLNQQGAQREEIKDGMDMSLCSLDRKNLKLEYAGAHNSLYIIRKGNNKLIVNGSEMKSIMSDKGHNLFEIKADKQPIGAFENRKNFTNHEIQLEKNDMVILFTDGYADQFGGPKGKKFFYKPFKRLLLSVADEDVRKQHEIIEQTFNEWISYPDSNGEAHEQIDDICVVGVRV